MPDILRHLHIVLPDMSLTGRGKRKYYRKVERLILKKRRKHLIYRVKALNNGGRYGMISTPANPILSDCGKGETRMLTHKFDTQLLIEGEHLSEDAIDDYISQNLRGDCLLVVGDEKSDQDSFPYRRALEGAGILRLSGGHPRHCSGKHGAPGERPARLKRGTSQRFSGKTASTGGAGIHRRRLFCR